MQNKWSIFLPDKSTISKINTAPPSADEEIRNRPAIDPYEYFSVCPRCNSTDFKTDYESGRCLSCNWSFHLVKHTKYQSTNT